MRYLGIAAVLIAYYPVAAPAQQVVYEVVCGGAAQLGVVVPRTEFNRENIRRIGAGLMSQYQRERLLFVIFADTPESINRSVHRGEVRIHDEGDSRSPNELTNQALQSASLLARRLPRALLVRIDKNAIIGFSNVGGPDAQYQFLGTVDPTIYSFGSGSYSLLHVYLAKAKALVNTRNACQMNVYLSAEAPLSVSECIRAQTRFQTLLPAIRITTKVRIDPWFLDDQGYPDVPVLLRNAAVPDPEAWPSAPRVSCWPKEWPMNLAVTCSGERFIR